MRKLIALRELVELLYGKALPERVRSTGNIPVFGSNGISGRHSVPLTDNPTIVVGRKGAYAGAVHLIEEPSWIIDTAYYVRILPSSDLLLPYLLGALRFIDLTRLQTATGIPGLNREDFYRQIISVPSLPEQRQIVDILNHTASIKRLRDEARAKVWEMIPALFVDMFGDPATNPKGWPVFPLRQVIAGIEGGKNLLAGDDEASGYRILKISAVTSGVFRADEAKPAPAGYVPPQSHFVRKGDILFSRANTVELVGATACVLEAPENLLLPDKLWRFIWRTPSQILPCYLLHFLKQPHTRAALSKMATGTSDSMRNISQAKLMTLPVPVASTALQQEFADRVAEIEGAVVLADKAAQAAEQLTQSLLSQVFGPVSTQTSNAA